MSSLCDFELKWEIGEGFLPLVEMTEYSRSFELRGGYDGRLFFCFHRGADVQSR